MKPYLIVNVVGGKLNIVYQRDSYEEAVDIGTRLAAGLCDTSEDEIRVQMDQDGDFLSGDIHVSITQAEDEFPKPVRYQTKPKFVEAIRWYKNGDHPSVKPLKPVEYDQRNKMVDTPGENIYPNSQNYWPGMEKTHGCIGWGGVVAPGDYVITSGKRVFALSPEEFEKRYELVPE